MLQLYSSKKVYYKAEGFCSTYTNVLAIFISKKIQSANIPNVPESFRKIATDALEDALVEVRSVLVC